MVVLVLLQKISSTFQTITWLNGRSFYLHLKIPFRFTLFDSIEDDEYDGFLGENDEEAPRALLDSTIYNNEVVDNSKVIKELQPILSPNEVDQEEKNSSLFENTPRLPELESDLKEIINPKITEEISTFRTVENVMRDSPSINENLAPFPSQQQSTVEQSLSETKDRKI